ncbi:hypothetical protein GCM10027280_08520 [Micromonospora polyrhachis]|uniref:Lanthionine synthetase C-like protein n=1 Tax=Micromonospora polyrhachis TaxID=1282883 RepID=A0A7W7SP28_9ACTN|nr:lanthionine synthetase LanC family protein [Micromonospora polyrhachis]MBB4958288.1 hypothetical protein [Micromonospora polyrhachis]
MRSAVDPIGYALARRTLTTAAQQTSAAQEVAARADWGIPLLARLVTTVESTPAADIDPTIGVTARRAVLTWVAQRRGGVAAARLYGDGLASLVVGLGHACAVEPRLRTVAQLSRDRLVAWCRQEPHPDGPLAVDYDLVNGVAGAVLALTASPDPRPEHLRPGLHYLLRLCTGPGLAGLRHSAREPDSRLRWNVGQLNHGLAHGVPGILAALVAAHPVVCGAERDEVTEVVARLAGHLCRSAIRDGRGVLTWRRGSDETAATTDPRRQAWCYGAPGVAWQLAEAARVLDDPTVSEVARFSMASLCAAWDDDYYLRAESADAQLSLCHGAPGSYAVARAFADHDGLAGAGTLAEHLRDRIVERLPGWYDSTRAGATMLAGTAGTLAVLLADGPTSRGWLAPLALR